MYEYSLNGLNIGADEFLESMYASHEIVRFRVFSDRKGSAFAGQNLEQQLASFPQFSEILKKHNLKNRGVFFLVNEGGHDDASINRINAHYAPRF